MYAAPLTVSPLSTAAGAPPERGSTARSKGLRLSGTGATLITGMNVRYAVDIDGHFEQVELRRIALREAWAGWMYLKRNGVGTVREQSGVDTAQLAGGEHRRGAVGASSGI